MAAEPLRLFDALQRWCDPVLVEAVKAEERCRTAYELEGTQRPQLTPSTERRRPTDRDWILDRDNGSWLAAWQALEWDLRRRIESGAIHVCGVQTKPVRQTEAQPIPAVWAGDFKFDFNAGAITVGEYRYTAVACSREPPAQAGPVVAPDAAPAASADAASKREIRPEDVPELSDETILALLEEHAKRVVEGPDAKLIAPGKVSLMPIVKRRMEYRATQGVLLPKLSYEAKVLAAWIASKVSSHPVPSASTIARSLGSTYAALRARSKAGIQLPKA